MRKVEIKTAIRVCLETQLTSLISRGKLSPTSRLAYKIEKYIAKLSKNELKGFI